MPDDIKDGPERENIIPSDNQFVPDLLCSAGCNVERCGVNWWVVDPIYLDVVDLMRDVPGCGRIIIAYLEWLAAVCPTISAHLPQPIAEELRALL
jgi:hypothetical protein